MPRMCCLVRMGGGPPSCPSTCGANLAMEKILHGGAAKMPVKARVRGGLAMCQLAFSGCGAGAPRNSFGATTLWNPFFVTMLMCHV